MAFRKKYESIIAYNPDVLIIQESENKKKLELALEKTNYTDLLWYGNNPHKGIAIISYNNFRVSLKKEFRTDFKYVIPIKLKTENHTYNMFCIWAMPNKADKTKGYVGQIWSAINHYHKDINENCILVGDFNSNKMWDYIKRNGNHSDVVNFLNKRRIISIYHHLRKIEHGDEKEPTLYLLKKKEKPYHIDYCFASENLINNETTISIGNYENWITLSDHMPIIIDNLTIK